MVALFIRVYRAIIAPRRISPLQMANRIALVVRDYDEATRFCVETLGLELIEDRIGANIDAALDAGRPCTQEEGSSRIG